MEVKENHYQKILDFICRIGEVDDLVHFLDYVDNFLQTDFKASPILVYSTNANAGKNVRTHRKKQIEEIQECEVINLKETSNKLIKLKELI